jgi:hypothetical protein
MKERILRLSSICLAIVIAFSGSAFAAKPDYGTSSTNNGVTTSISASSVTGDNTYEHVYLTTSCSSASSVGGTVWYYTASDSLIGKNSNSADTTWYKFDFKVKWTLLSSGAYAIGRGQATVNSTVKYGNYVDVTLA